jgi:hypothetical protein
MRKEAALRRVRDFLLVLGLSFFYILIFARSAEEELLVRPLWSLDADDSSISAGVDERIPFRLGPLIGYFGPDGRLAFREQIIHDAALFEERFVNYSSVSETAVLRDADGRVVRSINEPGYPLGLGERLYILHPDGAGLSEWGDDGEALWSRKLPSLVTDVAAGDSMTAVGLISGEIIVLDAAGTEVARYRTLGSRIPVVYGVSMNEASGTVAAVVGMDPQRLLFLNLRDGQLSPGIQGDLTSHFRRPVFLRFLPEYGLTAVETPTGVTFVSPGSGRTWPLEGEGTLSGFSAPPGQMVLLAMESEGRQSIQAVVPPGRLVFRLSVEADSVFLDVRDWVCYLGIEEHILSIALERG